MKKNEFPGILSREDLLFLSEPSFEAIKKTLPKERRGRIFANLLMRRYSPLEKDQSLLKGYGNLQEFNWKNVLDLPCEHNDSFLVLKRPRGCFKLKGKRKKFLAIPEQVLMEASFKEKMAENPPQEVIITDDIIKNEGYFRITEVILPLFLKKYKSFKEAPIYLIKDEVENVSMMISVARLQGSNVYSYVLYVKELEKENNWLCFSFISRFILLHKFSFSGKEWELIRRVVRYLWYLQEERYENTIGVLCEIGFVPGISIKSPKIKEDSEYDMCDIEYDMCDVYEEYEEYDHFDVYSLVEKPHERQDLDILISLLWEKNDIDIFGSLSKEDIKLLKKWLITEFVEEALIDKGRWFPSLLVDKEKGVILSRSGWGLKFERPFGKFIEHIPKWFEKRARNRNIPLFDELEWLSDLLLELEMESAFIAPETDFIDALLDYCKVTKTCRYGPIQIEKVDFNVELDGDLFLITNTRQKSSEWDQEVVFLVKDEQGQKFYWSIFQVFYIEDKNGEKWRIEFGKSHHVTSPEEWKAWWQKE